MYLLARSQSSGSVSHIERFFVTHEQDTGNGLIAFTTTIEVSIQQVQDDDRDVCTAILRQKTTLRADKGMVCSRKETFRERTRQYEQVMKSNVRRELYSEAAKSVPRGCHMGKWHSEGQGWKGASCALEVHGIEVRKCVLGERRSKRGE